MNNKDRTNFTKLTRSGISLIVLIIMIIVVIVLASVVILTISKNNPLRSAKEATFKSDVRNFQDELSMYVGNQVLMDYGGTREKIETDDMPSTEIMKSYIESFSSKYENKLGIYKDELVYYKPDEDVKNKVTDEEEKWLQDLGIKKKIVETREESFEWGSDDPNNPEYYTLTKFIGGETNVIVPTRCHKVGNDAFRDSKITSVKLQEGVTNIGTMGFYNCRNLVNVSLPNSLTTISTFAFSICSNLKNITIPKNVKAIFTCAFSNCDKLEEVILPDNLFGIHNEAFKSCKNLKTIKLPESIGYIGRQAFCDTGLTSITIPKSLNNIEGGAFSNCKELVSINVDENNSTYTSVDGVLYTKTRGGIVQFPAGKELESYIIDNNVEYILNNAFYGCDNLKSITLGNNVKSIGEYSFMYCSNLTDINIPSSLEEIKYNSFGVCSNLSNIYIPANVQKIGSIAFHMCYNLTIDCEVEESNIPNGWSGNWYGSAKAVNYGVKK